MYETLLRQACEHECGPDPRLALGSDSEQLAEFHRLKAQAAKDAQQLFTRRLKAGKPLTVARWLIGGHNIPVPRNVPMFGDRSVRAFVVNVDDTIRPVR